MRPKTTRGPIARLLSGLSALILLAVLLAGIPAGLFLLAGNPVEHAGDLGDLFSAMLRPDDGTLLTGLLVWVGWLGWASFAIAFLLEMVGHIAGWRPKVVGLRWQQRVSAALIAAIATAVLSPVAASAHAAFAAPPAVVLTVQSPPAAALNAAASLPEQDVVPQASSRYLEYTASRTEALLDLADRYGVPADAIAEATVGLQQPDGRTMQRGQTLIRAGWTVRIPVGQSSQPPLQLAASTTELTAAEDNKPQLSYTVDRNDWLYYIAERYLGDGDRYPEIAALNPQYADRHNASNTRHFPDHIETGWKLTLPAGAYDRGENRHAGGHATPLTPAPAPVQPVPPPAEEPNPVAPAQPAAPPSISPSLTPSPGPSIAPSNVAPTAPANHTQGQLTDQDDNSLGIAIGSGLTAASLLAGLVVLLLRKRRRSQQQHRRSGRRIATPPDPKPEVAVRTAARPADVNRLDLSLRAVAERTAGRPAAELPDIAVAWLSFDSVSFVLAQPSSAPAPFAAAGPAAWTLHGDTAVDIDPEEHLSPAPALMTLGAQDSSQDGPVHLLVDAERPGVLSLTGDPRRCQDLLRYLAAEAAASSWADDSVVVLSGLSPDDTAALIALNESRVRAQSSVADTLTRAGLRAQAGAKALADAGAHDAVDGRINHNASNTWAPQLLFVSNLDGQHTEALAQLDAQLKDTPRAMVAVVALTTEPTAWSVNIDPDGTLTMPWLATPQLTASQLTSAQLGELAATITKARPRPQRTTVFDHVATDFEYPFDEPVPAATEDWADGTDAHGHLLSGIADEFADSLDDDGEVDADIETGGGDVEDGEETEPAAEPVTVGLAARVNGHSPLTAAVATARRAVPDDPALDGDLAAWNDADKTRPCIGILGPITVETPGFVPEERLRFYSEVVVFMAQRGKRGATAEEIISALWMDEPIGRNSLRVALSRVRRWLGEDPEGTPWMPGNSGEAPYRLKDGYLLDWHLFRRLRARGESRGSAGAHDLRSALELVRGVPLEEADHRHGSNRRTPYAWLPNSEIPPYHLTAAIVDTAHTLVGLYLQSGDHEGARWAVDRAWMADPDHTDDHPWQDRMRIAAAEGHEAELRAIVADLMNARQAEALVDLSRSTYAVILELGLDAVLQEA